MQLPKELIALGAEPTDKHAAIRLAAKLLSDHGKVAEAYVDGMLARELQENTYLGYGVAVPHGTLETQALVHKTSVAVVQVPKGIVWGEQGETVHLIVAIAANNAEHVQLLQRLTRLLSSKDLQLLYTTTDPADIQNAFLEDSASLGDNCATAPETVQMAATIPNPLGLHARPAAQLVKLARGLESPVFLRSEKGEAADARQLMPLLALGLEQHSHVLIESDSEQAAKVVASAIREGLGENLATEAAQEEKLPVTTEKQVIKPVQQSPNNAASQKTPLWSPVGEIESITGIPASEGLAFGRICHYEQYCYQIAPDSREPIAEAAALDWALSVAARDIFATMSKIAQRLGSAKADIFNAHLAILNDEMILNDTINRIANGNNAALAYKTVLEQKIALFETQPSATLASRSADLRDVRDRVLKILLGIEEQVSHFPPNSILCAEHLTPAIIARLPSGQVFGLISQTGAPTDHNAIIARGMGLPAVVGVSAADLSRLEEGTTVIIDANVGKIYLNPTPEQYQAAQETKEKIRSWQQQALISRMQPGHTKDGKRIDILANINHSDVASAALDTGAEGVGLMRTESLFLKAENIPTENEQFAQYIAMANKLADRPLIIRTVDLGGKIKPAYLDFSALEDELIPSRGLRLALANPDCFLPQLRAICRVARECGNVKVMFPMVTTLEDFLEGKALLEKVRAEIDCPPIPVGALIETPSAALLAHHLLQYADFLSIGTNDLSRYALVSHENQDALHPAVLQLIDGVVRAAKRVNKSVSLCGDAAGDVLAAKIFVGLGVDCLSIRPPQIATIKQALCEANSNELTACAQQALSLSNAKAVRSLSVACCNNLSFQAETESTNNVNC